MAKYGRSDVRDILERASARETAARVAAGAIARQLLAHAGVGLTSHVFTIGNAGLPDTHVPLTSRRLFPTTPRFAASILRSRSR